VSSAHGTEAPHYGDICTVDDKTERTIKDAPVGAPEARAASVGPASVAAAWEAHCLLGTTLETLASIERRRKDRSQDLALGIEALAAVVELIQADPRSQGANAAGPQAIAGSTSRSPARRKACPDFPPA
jgi:hypothetical protein